MLIRYVDFFLLKFSRMYPLSRENLKQYVAAHQELVANYPVIERPLRKWIPYEDAVALNETRIYARHIAKVVQKASFMGLETIDIPVLPRAHVAFHMRDGNLNHENPGPIQYDYVPKVIEFLKEVLPGVDLQFIHRPLGESVLHISWT
jgi:hypothetical protein